MEMILMMVCFGMAACFMMIMMGFKWWMEMAGILPCPPDPTMLEPERVPMPQLKSINSVDGQPFAVRTQQYNKELM